MTIPPAYLKDTGLGVGSVVDLVVTGEKLTISPARKRLRLSDILASAPKDAHKMRARGWETMKPAGRESF